MRALWGQLNTPALPLVVKYLPAVAAGLYQATLVAGRSRPDQVSLSWVVAAGVGLVAQLAAMYFPRFAATRIVRFMAWTIAGYCLTVVAAIYVSDELNHLLETHSATVPLLMLGPPVGMVVVHFAVWAWKKCGTAGRMAMAIALLGLALRTIGAGWDLPYLFHPDESVPVAGAMEMLQTGDLNPRYFINPPLLTYVFLGEFSLFLLLGRAAGVFDGPADLPQLFGHYPTGFYIAARATSAMIGAASVVIVYVAGRNLAGRGPGLVAAAALAVSFLHVRDSHYATNDVLVTAFVILATHLAISCMRGGSSRHLAAAFVVAGLAMGTKYSGIVAMLPPLIALLVVWRDSPAARRSTVRRLPMLFLPPIVFVAVVPFAFTDFPTFSGDVLQQFDLTQHRWSGQTNASPLWLLAKTLPQAVGWATVAATGIGIVALSLRPSLRAVVLLSAPTAYLGLIAWSSLYFVRFALPLLPFICICAGIGVGWTARLAGKNSATWILGAVSIVLIAQPLALDIRHHQLLRRSDTRILADRWIHRTVSGGARVAVEPGSVLDVRLNRWRERFGTDSAVPGFELLWSFSGYSVDGLRAQGFSYAAVSSYGRDRSINNGKLPVVYAELERKTQLVARFAPGRDGADLEFRLDEIYTPFWNLFDRDILGPTILIYDLR